MGVWSATLPQDYFRVVRHPLRSPKTKISPPVAFAECVGDLASSEIPWASFGSTLVRLPVRLCNILVFSGFLSLPLLKDDKAIGVADVDASEERGWQ
jgi:hypothetical protein